MEPEGDMEARYGEREGGRGWGRVIVRAWGVWFSYFSFHLIRVNSLTIARQFVNCFVDELGSSV